MRGDRVARRRARDAREGGAGHPGERGHEGADPVTATADTALARSLVALERADGIAPHECTQGAPKVPRRFQVFGTGHPLPQNARYVGTCPRVSGLVWHLFELVSDEDEGYDSDEEPTP